MKLSILICTLEERKPVFDVLKTHLEEQIKGLEEFVEVRYKCDNKEITVGKKRQLLLEESQAEYVSFIDDDDWVPNNYVLKILEGINTDADCIGFQVALDGWDNNRIVCDLSNKWDGWHNDRGGFRFVRCPNHLSVIKREHALVIGYPDKKGGEDADFSLQLKASGLIKTEHYIPEIMYEYRFKHGLRSWA